MPINALRSKDSDGCRRSDSPVQRAATICAPRQIDARNAEPCHGEKSEIQAESLRDKSVIAYGDAEACVYRDGLWSGGRHVDPRTHAARAPAEIVPAEPDCRWNCFPGHYPTGRN